MDINNIIKIIQNTEETYIEVVYDSNGEPVERTCMCTPESIKESILEDIEHYKQIKKETFKK